MNHSQDIAANHLSLNQYFDNIYVLNLEIRVDRKITMLQKLNRLKIGATFVKAVNGYSAQNIKEHQNYVNQPIGIKGSHLLEIAFQRKLIKSPGAWGCLKTFLNILKDAKKNNSKRILCFEDDVVFHKEFNDRFRQSVQNIPEDWKLLLLGASQFNWHIPNCLSYPDKRKKNVDFNEPFYFPKKTDGAFAIGIHYSVYDLLIKETLKMNCPFDSGPLRTVFAKYQKKCFVLTPNLVIADVTDSNIRERQNQQSIAKQMKWNMEDYEYPFQKDLASVIMPAFNAEKTIEKSIRSMLIQTYEQLEIIVVDDASSDKTVEIVRQLMREDSRIHLVSLTKNKGVGGARNAGLVASNGNIIAFQDADDVSLKTRIEKQVIPLYENNVLFTASRIIRSRCSAKELDIKDQKKMLSLVEHRRKTDNQGDFQNSDKAVYGLVTLVYKRKVFEEFGMFEEHRYGEDMEMLERVIFLKTKKNFDYKQNGYVLLNFGEEMPTIFKKINELLLVCPEMNEHNLTNQYNKKRKENQLIQKKFRGKYRSGNLGSYPKLKKVEFNWYAFNRQETKKPSIPKTLWERILAKLRP